MTVVQYLRSDILRKARSFRIGVFTIFLIVSFVTVLKGVVDAAPVVFLKLAQDGSGNFDFQLASDYGERLVNGDLNYYDGEPFVYS